MALAWCSGEVLQMCSRGCTRLCSIVLLNMSNDFLILFRVTAPGTAAHCFFPDPTEDVWPDWLASITEYFHFVVEEVDSPGACGICCGGGIWDVMDAGGEEGGSSWFLDGGA